MREPPPLFDESPFEIERFSGITRVFPLPNLVLFPHVMQPMHIFEPRYKALLQEALAGDGLLTLGVLAPGWEGDYEGRPPLLEYGCLCRVMNYHLTDKNTYNVLLVGVRRLQLITELPPEKLYREFQATILEDEYPLASEGHRDALQAQLLDVFQRALPKLADGPEQLREVLGQRISLGTLCDIISYTLDMPPENKVGLLAETVVDRRAERLLEHFQRILAGQPASESESQNSANGANPSARRSFPPDFSQN
ncbi:MAG: LON peptidase substrate-binding domain-containing protein [Pirellulales bacterium]|nr:LON peptidase substrate-binding domain-containing protein [Pirellulales bacterium]